jgi:hypothetical protein
LWILLVFFFFFFDFSTCGCLLWLKSCLCKWSGAENGRPMLESSPLESPSSSFLWNGQTILHETFQISLPEYTFFFSKCQ